MYAVCMITGMFCAWYGTKEMESWACNEKDRNRKGHRKWVHLAKLMFDFGAYMAGKCVR